MTNESVTITLILTNVPGKAKEMDDLFIAIVPDTRKFQSCRSAHAYRHQIDENRMIVIEEWESVAAYEKYVAWRQNSPSPLSALLAEPPQVDFWPRRVI
jgi:quinol monooxygenase YgiN